MIMELTTTMKSSYRCFRNSLTLHHGYCNSFELLLPISAKQEQLFILFSNSLAQTNLAPFASKSTQFFISLHIPPMSNSKQKAVYTLSRKYEHDSEHFCSYAPHRHIFTRHAMHHIQVLFITENFFQISSISSKINQHF